jgi:hypothetical protein
MRPWNTSSSGGFEAIPEVVRSVAPSVVAVEVRTEQGADDDLLV